MTIHLGDELEGARFCLMLEGHNGHFEEKNRIISAIVLHRYFLHLFLILLMFRSIDGVGVMLPSSSSKQDRQKRMTLVEMVGFFK